jgi:hypothetical protein
MLKIVRKESIEKNWDRGYGTTHFRPSKTFPRPDTVDYLLETIRQQTYKLKDQWLYEPKQLAIRAARILLDKH